MPGRSRTSFKKRQKELLRVEKQREKAAKRLARKPGSLDAQTPEPEDPTTVDGTESREDSSEDVTEGKAPSAPVT
jgi:hypothetical protein